MKNMILNAAKRTDQNTSQAAQESANLMAMQDHLAQSESQYAALQEKCHASQEECTSLRNQVPDKDRLEAMRLGISRKKSTQFDSEAPATRRPDDSQAAQQSCNLVELRTRRCKILRESVSQLSEDILTLSIAKADGKTGPSSRSESSIWRKIHRGRRRSRSWNRRTNLLAGSRG